MLQVFTIEKVEEATSQDGTINGGGVRLKFDENDKILVKNQFNDETNDETTVKNLDNGDMLQLSSLCKFDDKYITSGDKTGQLYSILSIKDRNKTLELYGKPLKVMNEEKGRMEGYQFLILYSIP